jgi:2-amino-4-hydroxy-6-hydroxymethyldihydropteridine diphosphokinase
VLVTATAYLSLGSNLGDRAGNLAMARERILREFPGARFSPVYETEPVEVEDQPWFLNQAVEVATGLTPGLLLQWAQNLETELGRKRGTPKGPRTLDVDILLYDDLVLEGVTLTLPHPRLLHRRHVLLPLSDLNPALRVPPDGILVTEALRNVADHAEIRLTK